MPHKTLILCGIGDHVQLIRLLTWHWRLYGVDRQVLRVGWYDHDDIHRKLKTLDQYVTQYTDQGYKVSLVGISAGGSLALNYFSTHHHSVDSVITVGSRLKCKQQVGIWSLRWCYLSSSIFLSSVQRLMSVSFDKNQKKRILIVRARFGDQLARPNDMTLPEVKEELLSIPGHQTSIMAALTIYSRLIFKFLKYGV